MVNRITNGSSTNGTTNGTKVHHPTVVIHGGSGDVPEWRVPLKINGVKNAAIAAYKVLSAGGHAVDAVEAALRSMENDEYLNAGYGSVLNLDGDIEMDASIMNGENLKAGCISLVHDIQHPISLARRVMEKSNKDWSSPCFFAAHGAMTFAKENGFEILPPGALVTNFAKESLIAHKAYKATEAKQKKNFGEVGTVGAVALDIHGNIAAATTTGGMTGKIPGRIGDTPQIGSGTYADNKVGGTSSTGTGEVIMRYNLAANVMKRMEWLGKDAQTATEESVKEMTEKLIETGGSITIDKNGSVGIFFSSNIMPWAKLKDDVLSYGTKIGDNFEEILDK